MQLKGTIVAFAIMACTALLAPPAAHGSGAERARAEVKAAEQAVQAARERRALWTTAQDALAQAQAALDRGDYAAAVRAARIAAEQAQLGIAQTAAPRFP
jgi:hypothetical protein